MSAHCQQDVIRGEAEGERGECQAAAPPWSCPMVPPLRLSTLAPGNSIHLLLTALCSGCIGSDSQHWKKAGGLGLYDGGNQETNAIRKGKKLRDDNSLCQQPQPRRDSISCCQVSWLQTDVLRKVSSRPSLDHPSRLPGDGKLFPWLSQWKRHCTSPHPVVTFPNPRQAGCWAPQRRHTSNMQGQGKVPVRC